MERGDLPKRIPLNGVTTQRKAKLRSKLSMYGVLADYHSHWIGGAG